MTVMAKYGVDSVNKLPSVIARKKATCIARYGSESTIGIDVVKNKRIAALSENKEAINDKRRIAWTDELVQQAKNTRSSTVLERYGVSSVSRLEEVRSIVSEKTKLRYESEDFLEKIKSTLMAKYGVDNVMKIGEVKELAKRSCLVKYGVEYYLASDDRRRKLEVAGKWIPLELLRDFEVYRRNCIVETNKHKKILYSNWDGTCYYTTNILLTDKTKYNDPLYATIDHKYSIFNGYMNGVSPEVIGAYDNLCICSRLSNTRKGVNNA